uniref:Uncharacterized protein n=1 Tax=Oryza brachyantha TaxID=4533 RepID=J3MGF3_ORYBR
MRPGAEYFASAPAQAANGTAAAAPHSPWQSPVPYLFGGLAAMLGLIAFALLILACSYWKLSGYLDGGSASGQGGSTAGEAEGEKGAEWVRFPDRFLVTYPAHVYLQTNMAPHYSCQNQATTASHKDSWNHKTVAIFSSQVIHTDVVSSAVPVDSKIPDDLRVLRLWPESDEKTAIFFFAEIAHVFVQVSSGFGLEIRLSCVNRCFRQGVCLDDSIGRRLRRAGCRRRWVVRLAARLHGEMPVADGLAAP